MFWYQKKTAPKVSDEPIIDSIEFLSCTLAPHLNTLRSANGQDAIEALTTTLTNLQSNEQILVEHTKSLSSLTESDKHTRIKCLQIEGLRWTQEILRLLLLKFPLPSIDNFSESDYKIIRTMILIMMNHFIENTFINDTPLDQALYTHLEKLLIYVDTVYLTHLATINQSFGLAGKESDRILNEYNKIPGKTCSALYLCLLESFVAGLKELDGKGQITFPASIRSHMNDRISTFMKNHPSARLPHNFEEIYEQQPVEIKELNPEHCKEKQLSFYITEAMQRSWKQHGILPNSELSHQCSF